MTKVRKNTDGGIGKTNTKKQELKKYKINR